MKYKYLIPKYIDGHFATIDFDNLFVVQFFKADPIELFFETKTQDYNYEKYVENLYKKIIDKFEKTNNFIDLLKDYRFFKESYNVHYRWRIYEKFCDYLIEINKPEDAFEEWIILQEEERLKSDGSFTYRDSALQRLIYFESILKRGLINGYHIHKIAEKGHQLTAFGKRNIKEVFLTLDIIIKNTISSSFFEQFYSNYNFEKFKKNKSHKYEYYNKYFQHNNKVKKHWEWIVNISSNYILKDGSASTNLVFDSIRSESSRLLRESENKYRSRIGAKKIGESWISETELYYKIQKAFPKIKIIQHGKPNWIGRQHLDIWIPEFKIAIEYQGKQHDEPIDFFGGIESFKKIKKLDKLKKEKCDANGVKLLEVRKGYDLQKIINKIKNSIDVDFSETDNTIYKL